MLIAGNLVFVRWALGCQTVRPWQREVRRYLISLLGRSVSCEACGRELFRGLAVVSRGQVKVINADEALVGVDFVTTSRLGFRHVDLSQCRRAGSADVDAHRPR
jgi:hypothetical protein